MIKLAQPVKLLDHAYVECPIPEASHIRIRLQGWVGLCVVPFHTGKKESKGPCWFWNESLDKPTLSPSLLSQSRGEELMRCHCFIENGKVRFLSDCTHKFAGKTVDMLPVCKEDYDKSHEIK